MEYRLLGPLEVCGDAGPVRFVGTRVPALLATLLLHANRPVTLDRLATGVWRSPPHAVASNLRTYVAQLREAFAAGGSPGRLVTEAGGYRLRVDAAELDLTAFERLAQAGEQALRGADADAALDVLGRALELWRGEALAGLTASPLLRTESARLEQRRLAVMRNWASAALAAGRPAEAAAELAGMVHAQPLDEQAWALLMTALYRCGRQGEALAAYQKAYKVLDSELGVAPSRHLQELHQRILTADAALDLPEVRHEWTVEARMPAPRQLPLDVADFTGRAEQLARLDGLLPAAPLVVLCGQAGVGKTVLAVHWAHRVSGSFPDGQIYLDLHGYAPVPPLAPIDALSATLRALGVAPQCVPALPDEAAALYRSLLAGRRMLVLLDNAASAEQVRPLLPGAPDCAVLVTSRDRLAGLVASHGARRVDLDVLTAAEAVGLLAAAVGAERVGAEPSAAADLARRCGYLPLALRVVAARLVGQPGASIAEHAADLAGEDRLRVLEFDEDPGTGVTAAFGVSYERLPEPARRLFRRIGLLDGPDLDAATAARLLDVSDPTAELHALERGHLLQNDGTKRFRPHDLLRLYARTRALADEPEPERRSAIHRVARWQLGLARRAGRILYPGVTPADDSDADTSPAPTVAREIPTPADALRWFAAERRNICALAGTLATAGTGGLAARLLLALTRYVQAHGYGDDWLSLMDRVQRAAVADGEERLAALLRVNSARYRDERGDPAGANAGYAEAAEIFQRLGDRRLELTARLNVAVTHHRLGHPRKAARAYLTALRVARQVGERRIEAYALANLAAARRDLGQHRLGVRYGRRARDLFRAIDDWQGEAEAIDTIADIHRSAGDLPAAITAHRAALRLVAGRDRRREADVRRGLGVALAANGDVDEAVVTLREAVPVLVELGAPQAQEARRLLATLDRGEPLSDPTTARSS